MKQVDEMDELLTWLAVQIQRTVTEYVSPGPKGFDYWKAYWDGQEVAYRNMRAHVLGIKDERDTREPVSGDTGQPEIPA